MYFQPVFHLVKLEASQPVVLDWEAREKAKQEAERQAEEKDSFSSNDKELLGLLDEIPPAE